MKKLLGMMLVGMTIIATLACAREVKAYVDAEETYTKAAEIVKETTKPVTIEIESETETETEAETEVETTEAVKPNPYSEIFDNMTDEEYWLLCAVTQAEGGVSNDECMIANVETVLNRVLDPSNRFKNNIKDVIYQKGEFVTAKYLKDVVVTDRAIDAVEYVIANGNTLLELDYVYFAREKMPYSKDHVYYGYPDGVGHWYGRAKK